MAVDAIGSVLANGTSSSTSGTINQEGFIKLFLTQLQFQDPLEPVDNKEFLAQLAQFSNLEQSRQMTVNTESLLSMTSADQSLSLLSRKVSVQQESGATDGTVTAVAFTSSGPQLTVQTDAGTLTGVVLSQVALVRP
ncbi:MULTISPECIES: flagellar hook capping FlgD N-terminal domain-containing protein [Pseudoxanthomonas]|uniref:Basal-body rod modification protein FlgD n=1 Tax=Pseudoxanthomonas winnipegensis TaxID=2480810 RepID=A0AAW8GHV6_9GAMM|nr:MULTISPECIES: flagellar hook capping FlgD N-terminal domain-containing protein [Pseudoxanthomonas]MDQ1120663.1 flagellar basal-body rod modification protein FlgD [Pseudoxanthomonas winnipegensis]MDQ1133887.1 flagellar basal-body rod modification protein FlgD [Pseudoxanthomonas winnipegensis]MDR6139877.1 flagellar basal-body rod modification protein FlgD [Pseudoxanthomonas sp. SORGH_AS_0997]